MFGAVFSCFKGHVVKALLGLGAVVVALAAFGAVYVLGFTGTPMDSDAPFRIEGGSVRSVGASAMAGGAYMVIHNQSGVDDRLVAVRTNVSDRAELHGHTEDANGVMMMRPIEDGIPIPAGGQAVLERGG